MNQKIKNFFQPVVIPTFGSLALLSLRLVIGLAFVFHGWNKIQNPMGWMGPDSGVPGILQFLAAFSEFGGGIAWMIGLLTPLAALGLTFTMIVATAMHAFVMKDPFVASGPGMSSYEHALSYLVVSLVLLTLGAGKFSLDAKIFGQKRS